MVQERNLQPGRTRIRLMEVEDSRPLVILDDHLPHLQCRVYQSAKQSKWMPLTDN